MQQATPERVPAKRRSIFAGSNSRGFAMLLSMICFFRHSEQREESINTVILGSQELFALYAHTMKAWRRVFPNCTEKKRST